MTNHPHGSLLLLEVHMENLRALAKLSCWIMDEHLLGSHKYGSSPSLESQENHSFWHLAFEACGTFAEFQEFLIVHADHPSVKTIRNQWLEILKQTPMMPRRGNPTARPSF